MTQTLARIALCLSLLSPLGAQAQEIIDQFRSVSSDERISIEVLRGEVRIRTSEDNLFRVRGALDTDATGYSLESAAGRTRFEVEMPRNTRQGNADVGSQLEIEVPAGSTLEFQGVNVNVDVQGVNGGTAIHTVNGNILAQDLHSLVALSSVNGRIDSHNNAGTLELSTINGELRDSGSSGTVSFSSVNADIKVDSQAQEVVISTINGKASVQLTGTQTLNISTVNGDVSVRLADSVRPTVNSSTVGGDLRLSLEPQVNASFALSSSVGGDIDNRLSEARAVRDRFGPGSSLNFSHGDGSGSVEASSVNGDIEIDSL